jgi:hypothetical protein
MEQETQTCPICCEEKTEDITHLTCTHWFHKDCIKKHIKTRLLVKRDIECPVCRNIEFKNGTYDYNILVSSVAKVNNETKQRNPDIMDVSEYEPHIDLNIRDPCMNEINTKSTSRTFKIFILLCMIIILSVIFALLYNLDKLP